jgi:hypothetical protein
MTYRMERLLFSTKQSEMLNQKIEFLKQQYRNDVAAFF